MFSFFGGHREAVQSAGSTDVSKRTLRGIRRTTPETPNTEASEVVVIIERPKFSIACIYRNQGAKAIGVDDLLKQLRANVNQGLNLLTLRDFNESRTNRHSGVAMGGTCKGNFLWL